MKKLTSLFAVLILASTTLWAIDNVAYIDANGQSQSVNATEVISSENAVTWGAEGQTTWYVVTGADVQLTAGAICNGAVNLILADGAKLTATGITDMGNQIYTPGIQVSGDGNSLTIYGQTAQSGELIASSGYHSAGIGGGADSFGSNITINGGVIRATGGVYSAGIGGGYQAYGSNITINGGTVIAAGGIAASGIGSGGNADSSTNIKVATHLQINADSNNPPTTEIANTGDDLASSLKGKQYVTIKLGPLYIAKVAATEALHAAIDETDPDDIKAIAMAAVTTINAAKTTAEVDVIKNFALSAIAFAKAALETKILGKMGEPCDGCPAIEVTDEEETTITLYNPKQVKVKKTSL